MTGDRGNAVGAGPAALLADVRVVAAASVGAATWIYTLPTLFSPVWLIPVLLACLIRPFPGRGLVVGVAIVAAWTLIDAHARLDERLPVTADGSRVWVTGRVSGLPEAGPFRTRFVFDVAASGRRIRLSWYRDAPAIAPGDCLRLRIKRSTPHGSANPGEFDYTGWLWREGIDATGYVREAGRCDKPPAWTLDRLRAAALARLAPTLAGNPMRGIVEALTLGVRQHISDAQWRVLRATGTSHLVAISGLHIGLIAGLLFGLARWLALRGRSSAYHARWIACIAAFVGACAYAGLAGWALPTQRALVMVAAGLLALATARDISGGRALAWAALLVVFVDPPAVTAPGFWLSFTAVGWLIWIANGARGAWWQRWIGFQLGLMFVLTPVTLWFFGQASVIAPIINAILIPASVVFVPAVLVTALAALVVPTLGGPLLSGVAWLLGKGWYLLALAAEAPHVAVSHVLASATVLGAAMAGLCWLALPLPMRLRTLGVLMCLPLVLGYRPGQAPIPDGAFRLTVLDVGQGLASVVRTAHHTLVFDAGPAYRTGFDAGRMIVVPYLRHIGRTSVDRLLISHGDMDHIGGAAAIVDTLSVARRLGAGSDTPCHAGMHWRWDGVRFAIRSPLPNEGDLPDARNNRSCVLRISGPRGSALLTGDIEAEGERLMVDRAVPHSLASDVLVVPHHGSATSSSPALLAAVAPRVAIVSSGWHNRWHFPRPVVVARYRRHDIALYNTAVSGAIDVRWTADGVLSVQRWRVRHARFWQQPRPDP
ncbi:DNA internalization-related competence protein ComEC/Rec2 [Salinisphaera sp. Q1T1-3]|uniref:DNA internalization-related competence protein ComEC/Rec2 n=1 Tax=Salinisphaera sp. Q1T1-3 TaxID=2321229 RepID=UPI000E739206|nr:DNA internalization-related competence protein ComEC/Rec2 [Salinisphaera sp. Q1T1-3]RJS95374.1 DNA internalization-related competence protein ComEC/Rec2 [Salinisphaera sp. Q1T1-3]